MVIADRLLVERAKRGDQAALVEIYERCQPLVFTYVYYRVGGDQPCAEDLTSEVFVRMIDKLPGFQFQGKPLLAWLYTIARNLIIDRLRTNHQSRFPLAENLTADRTSHTAALAEAMLDHECLSRALEHLTDDQRQVILLKFVEDRSNAEIGKLLGKTEGAVKSLQHRALTALQRAIEQEQCYER